MPRPVLWNQLNEMRLRSLAERGFTDAEIAEGLSLYLPGITIVAVRHIRQRLKLYRPRGGPRLSQRHVTGRRCLSCGKQFKSEGKHNRICKPCARKIERMCA